MIVQTEFFARVAVEAVSTSVAPEVPELEPEALNVVLPQPEVVSATPLRVPNEYDGRTSEIESPASICTGELEVNATWEGAPEYGLLTTNAVLLRVATTMGVEVAITEALIRPSIPAKSAVVSTVVLIVYPGVEIPVEKLTLHGVLAFRVAVAAVRRIAAVDVPLAEELATKVVDPHPANEGVARVLKEYFGRPRVMVSPMSTSTIEVKLKVRPVGTPKYGLETVSPVSVNVAQEVAVEESMAAATISVADCSDTAAVLLASFKLAAVLGVSMPLAIEIVHDEPAARGVVAAVRTSMSAPQTGGLAELHVPATLLGVKVVVLHPEYDTVPKVEEML